MTLHLGRGIDLPDDAVTQTIGIIARKRAGKTHTAKVLVEEMLAAHLPVVVLDPKGDWWGLRSNARGDGPGLGVAILGGPHGQLPLEESAGRVIADLVATEPVALVLDMSDFPSKKAQVRFATDFAERLYRAKAQRHDVVMVVIDEADEFAPQSVRGDDTQRQLGAFETLVRRGAGRGIGVTMITQRPAVLNKSVLTQVEMLVLLQVTGPQDRDALGEWVKGNASPEELKRVTASLASLEVGEAWVWSPSWLRTLQRVRVRKLRTFDSGATPRPGEKRVIPKRLAEVDLAALKDAMAETIERAAASDPKKLQARVRELESQLARASKVETVIERETVEVVPTWVGDLLDGLDAIVVRNEQALLHMGEDITDGRVRIADVRSRIKQFVGAGSRVTPATVREAASRKDVKGSVTSSAPKLPSAPTNTDTKLTDAKRAILTVLAQHVEGRTAPQLTLQTGKAWSGGFRNYLADLRTSGYIEGANTATMRITDAGLAALGSYDQLPTGPALLDLWERRLGDAAATILRLLIVMYPAEATGPELAAEVGKEYSGGFRNYLSKLRTLGLIVGTNTNGMRASDDLIAAIT